MVGFFTATDEECWRGIRGMEVRPGIADWPLLKVKDQHQQAMIRNSRSKDAKKEGRAPLPVFLAAKRLKQFISNELEEGPAVGYPAELLPKGKMLRVVLISAMR